jgi:hypothetical protein
MSTASKACQQELEVNRGEPAERDLKDTATALKFFFSSRFLDFEIVLAYVTSETRRQTTRSRKLY